MLNSISITRRSEPGRTLKNIIAIVRREKNIKQRDLAKALDVSPSYLCKIEKEIIDPTEKFISTCSRHLDVKPDELFPDKSVKKLDKTLNNNFSNNLWAIRVEKGIKQNTLAEQIGCSPSYLSKVEKGIQRPNEKFRKKCAKILKKKEALLFPNQ